MSHFTTIRTEIYDLEILRETLTDLGFKTKEGDVFIGNHREGRPVDLVFGVDSQNLLGFKKDRGKKNYSIKGPTSLLTQDATKGLIKMIQQEYAYRKVLHETRKRGFSLIQEERVQPGVIKLVLRKIA